MREPTSMVSEELLAILAELKDVLVEEGSALRRGDAQKVVAISEQKEQLASRLEALEQNVAGVAGEVRMLGKQVRALARTNHAMIEQMNQHYTGLMTLMMRLSGDHQVYGQSGVMSPAGPRHMRRRTTIIA